MGDYFPSLEELRQLSLEREDMNLPSNNIMQMKLGHIYRTDGFDVDKTIQELEDLNKDGSQEGLISRIKSVSDLSSKLYDEFADNPNSIGNWLPKIERANNKAGYPFLIPKTKIWRLPIEVAQFIRVSYEDTSEVSRKLFNEMIFKFFELDNDKEYFIKTGTFSSKFEFRNAHIAKGEAREMGEYFQVINNFAMVLGAAHSVELCVREYIDDVEDNPTIYSGMPLRTEFRAFVDFDSDKIIGVVPYWNPIVMKRAFNMKNAPATIQQDLITYVKHEDKLMREYNDYLSEVKNKLKRLIPNVDLKGEYSVDIMKNGEDLYLIDMATMESSALVELLE